ncbi:MAG: helicase [Candidatus Taylorbacteria bacterium CG11_big_fil_rev_8_21_14_0_20_46_11]|uniref:Helicase n=1 Tax=Candidatus Taylorbacteria bacterium CG11_big_fil_rev_8_21_14_0_20_46_11 TaxID=1975025 RepID=A0A2H0KAT3_9BACT|nr:MAG: helicase [Candidatus Taylorbacteria bacterium CG11_big_fil_rev_8_21_14_0_20_46_11]
MRKVTFDIETTNFFTDTGSNDPASLTIACVCIHDSETDTYTSYYEEELSKLWPILEKTDLLIGYNSDHFDIPLLNKYYPGDLTGIKSLDLMKEIQKKLGRRIKLDSVASATLGKKKSADGSLANVWWRQGKKQEVVNYCIDDVKITKELYEYMAKHATVKYPDGKTVHEIAIDTKDWGTKKENVLTHTLPF